MCGEKIRSFGTFFFLIDNSRAISVIRVNGLAYEFKSGRSIT